MTRRTLIVEECFELAGTDEKLRVRMYAPAQLDQTEWACRIALGSPVDIEKDVVGVGSLQALALALEQVSALLYSHPHWREGKLGAFGTLGGYLGLPAPTNYLHFAPFPF